MQKYYISPKSRIMNIQGYNGVMTTSDPQEEYDALGGAPARTLYV